MHMADALVSPAVGAAFWAVSGGLIAGSARRIKESTREDIVPLMGVMGAFVFAAQMINIAIPGTGSSGHLAGGLMLAMLLGPHAAFLVMASVLALQALFFADGGLLALGCNMFNLGFFPAFIAYPLFRRGLDGSHRGIVTMLAALTGVLPGALAVVGQTTLSGLSEIPAGAFVLLMIPVHFIIGIAEGLATIAVVSFVRRIRPQTALAASPATSPWFVSLLMATLFMAGVISWFASSNPDGLEWSIARASGTEELAGRQTGVHEQFAAAQKKTAVLPGYDFAKAPDTSDEAWPAVNAGTTTAGLTGSMLTLGLIMLAGYILKRAARPRAA